MAEKVESKHRNKNIKAAAWDASNTKRIAMKLNVRTDSDIIDHLVQQESMQGYIKQLIRDDIARHNAAESF